MVVTEADNIYKTTIVKFPPPFSFRLHSWESELTFMYLHIFCYSFRVSKKTYKHFAYVQKNPGKKNSLPFLGTEI